MIDIYIDICILCAEYKRRLGYIDAVIDKYKIDKIFVIYNAKRWNECIDTPSNKIHILL